MYYLNVKESSSFRKEQVSEEDANLQLGDFKSTFYSNRWEEGRPVAQGYKTIGNVAFKLGIEVKSNSR